MDKRELLRESILAEDIRKVREYANEETVNDCDVLRALGKCTELEIVDHILKFNPDLNKQKKYHEIPLSVAITCSNLPVLRKFLAHGANPNQYDYDGFDAESPLCKAITQDKPEILQALLEGGAKVDQPIGGMPRLEVPRVIEKHIYRTLLAPNILPYDYAIKASRKKMADIIKKHAKEIGAEYTQPAVSREILDKAQKLRIEHQIEERERDLYETSTEKLKDSLCKIALIKTYNLNSKVSIPLKITTEMLGPNLSYVNPALHNAVLEGKYNKVLNILKRGVDVNETGANGNTALHYAATYGHKEIAQLLVKNSAKMYICNSSGKKPLELAEANGHKELYKDMLDGPEAFLDNSDHIPLIQDNWWNTIYDNCCIS